MKKLNSLIVSAALVAAFSGVANATPYSETFLGTKTDSSYFDVYEGYTAKFSFNLTGTGDGAELFNSNNVRVGYQSAPNPDATGFVPGSTINSAFLNFNFSSTDPAAEKVTIRSGYYDGNTLIAEKSYSLGTWLTNLTGVYSHADLSLDLNSLGLSQYLTDGKFVTLILALDFTQCSAPLNDFRIDQANLAVDATAPVPEPGTIMLLGSGLIGTGLLMRKKKM